MKFKILLLICFFGQTTFSIMWNLPQVRIDANANGVIVFQDQANQNILSSTNAGAGWSASVIISGSQIGANNPKLTIDPISGYGAAVWESQDPISGVTLLNGSVYTPSSGATPGWSTPVQITNTTVSVVPGEVVLDMNQGGAASMAFASWSHYDTTTGDLQIGTATATIASGWGTFTIIS